MRVFTRFVPYDAVSSRLEREVCMTLSGGPFGQKKCEQKKGEDVTCVIGFDSILLGGDEVYGVSF
jgi:hypothetical protein